MKVVIDISHIMSWKGRLTGIERAEYHIIKHYYDTTDSEFIYWHDNQGRFLRASRQLVRTAVIERTNEVEQKAVPPSNFILHRAYRKFKRLKHRRFLPQEPLPKGTLVVLAGLWGNKTYIHRLERLAEQHRLIHVVYDMIPLVQHGYVVDYLPRVFGNYMYKILPLCSGILAISEATAHDTAQALRAQNLPVPPIVTFRLGNDVSSAKESIPPKGITNDFILSVGTIEARKNHILLYYMYKRLLGQGRTLPQLIIVGRRGWLSSDFQYMVEHDDQTKDQIILRDDIGDAELRWLYEHCLFTVTPSFYEGWGLPVAESLYYGKVTLSSETSSMPEIGGDLADYFSPFETEGLTKLTLQYLSSRARKTRETYIRANYQPYKWEDTVVDFEHAVQQLVAEQADSSQ